MIYEFEGCTLDAATQEFDVQLTALEVLDVEVGDLELSARRRSQ